MTGPDYLARTAKEVGDETKWTNIGVAYINQRGSITVYLSALPLTDTIILVPTKRE